MGLSRDCVFVREPQTAEPSAGTEGGSRKFRRVKIQVAQENADYVVVADGLKGGQDVVTNGSLILSQLYEDQAMTSTGLAAR